MKIKEFPKYSTRTPTRKSIRSSMYQLQGNKTRLQPISNTVPVILKTKYSKPLVVDKVSYLYVISRAIPDM